MKRLAFALSAVLAVWAAPAAASACAQADRDCLRSAIEAADSERRADEASALVEIERWDGNLTDDDRLAWKARFAEESAAWGAYADRRCGTDDAGADGLRCRLALTTVRRDDIAARYYLLSASARYRGSVDVAGAPQTGDDSEAVESAGEEYGPCKDAPVGDCDLCGVGACFETLLSAATRRMEKALSDATRGAGAVSVAAEQKAWSDFVDLACENAGWETPNRWAHSIGVLVIQPCRLAEIEARAERLEALAARP